MIYRDPKCVFVANDGPTANMIAGLLTGAGFPAEVMNEATWGGFEGVTALLPGYSHKGMEVWVVDPAHVQPAKEFLEQEEQAIQAMKQRHAARIGTVEAVCEECGKSSQWPASQMGSTQDCPHCAAYMDLPDPDESWNESDFAGGEEETGEDHGDERK